MCSRIFKSIMVVCIAVSISGCQESQEKQETPVTKPAPTAPTRKPPRVVTGEEKNQVVGVLLKRKMMLKYELETNLKKLREDLDDGTISLSEAELNYVEKNLNDAIANEENEIEAYKADLDSLEITVETIGTKMFMETNASPTLALESQGNRRIRRDGLTGKPTSEKEMNIEAYSPKARPLKMYRFDGEGKRYLYATYRYATNAGNLITVEILNRDGTVRERFYANIVGSLYVIKTSIGEDKWIMWPSIKFANQRIKLIVSE